MSKAVFDEVFDPKNFIMSDGTETVPMVSVYKDDKYITTGYLTMKSEKFKEFCIDNADEDIEYMVKRCGKMPPYKTVYFDARTGLQIKIYDLARIGE